MKKRDGRYLAGAISGALFGFLILHPFSMVFQKLVHPNFDFDLARVLTAFSVHHLPMAVFFAVLGMAFGLLATYYTTKIMESQERIQALERFLPICAYCKKIRDDEGKEHGTGDWYNVDTYLRMKMDAEFTHGMCPDCYERVMKEFNEESRSGD